VNVIAHVIVGVNVDVDVDVDVDVELSLSPREPPAHAPAVPEPSALGPPP
jgi:hypothetical protein